MSHDRQGAGARLSHEELLRRAEAYREHGTLVKAAAALGIKKSAFHDSIKRAAEVGLLGTSPVLPGFRLTKTTAITNEDGDVVREFIQQRPDLGEQFNVPDGHSVKGVSALVDAQGRIMQQWVKTREEPSAVDIAETLKAAFEDWQPAAKPQPAPTVANTDLLTLTPLADLHLGLFSWGKETGINWDLEIGEKVIGHAIEDLVARTPPSGEAIVLGGGDLLQSDNNENKTARSGNVLQVDGRYQKVLMAACTSPS